MTISWDLKRTVDPPADPVTVDQAKNQSRVETSADDSLIQRLIEAATAQIDGPYGIGVCLVEQTWELTLDRFPTQIDLPIYPVQSVESIKYVDSDGNTQTLSSSVYRVDTRSNPARITLEWNESWPTARLVTNAVTVEFKAGYAPDTASSPTDYQANIPADLQHALLLMVGHFYENRESVIVGTSATALPMGVQAILDRYRVPGVA